jgi:two-component system phosphate regulon response regulator OmpR
MEPSHSLFLLDDDEKLNERLGKYLCQFGFTLECYTRPLDMLSALKMQEPDLLIVDVMLPGIDGFEVCRRIRKESTIPVIMLTARGDVADRIVGLEIGADDYLPKPFEPRELVARIKAILRRKETISEKETVCFGPMKIEFKSRKVFISGNDVCLTTAEFDLLDLFVKSPGKVLDRDYILDHLKGYEHLPFDRSIDVLLSRLRQKLNEEPKKSLFFKTVWGKGYMFIGHELGNNDE